MNGNLKNKNLIYLFWRESGHGGTIKKKSYVSRPPKIRIFISLSPMTMMHPGPGRAAAPALPPSVDSSLLEQQN